MFVLYSEDNNNLSRLMVFYLQMKAKGKDQSPMTPEIVHAKMKRTSSEIKNK